MVSNLKIIFMIITLIISFGVPITLGIIFCKKYNGTFKAILIGALVFFIFQMIIRIPMLQVFSRQSWYIAMSKNHLFFSIFLGLTAGIFEEIGRFLGFKFFLKDRLNFENGLAFGAGHGGIEAILLVGLTYINNLIYSNFINAGKLDEVFAGKVPQQTIEMIKNMLINTPDYNFLLAGIERIFAITIQIALSLLVLQSVRDKKWSYLIIAILIHMLIDTPIALMSMKGVNVFILEGITMIFAIIALIYILKQKGLEKTNAEV
ncbi:hypothetical protein ABG79_01811 [Caloramator mitchellensis]|uniref:YhfC family intramembrane metalloprotease n=1 Tax=Caloramator mitchellensis TaxID=908809 RepID=A0A0R3JYW1_CALMK|nr:YhfC family glutamic-type intramembrane protease [Caloramator mitchellensis]KRQ86430.1 hypothetical protein ABG79_01811 [Caloramator mitchellensis]